MHLREWEEKLKRREERIERLASKLRMQREKLKHAQDQAKGQAHDYEVRGKESGRGEGGKGKKAADGSEGGVERGSLKKYGGITLTLDVVNLAGTHQGAGAAECSTGQPRPAGQDGRCCQQCRE